MYELPFNVFWLSCMHKTVGGETRNSGSPQGYNIFHVLLNKRTDVDKRKIRVTLLICVLQNQPLLA